MLYATYPADLLAYVNKPIGEARVVPGPLPPHIACPTTCGTGSECTGIAVFDYVAHARQDGNRVAAPATHARARRSDGDAHAPRDGRRRERVRRAVPRARVVHGARVHGAALARRSRRRGRCRRGATRGATWGAARRCGSRGNTSSARCATRRDVEAREALSWAATLAGIAFGNSGVHLPHAMSYSVAGLVREYRCEGYPAEEAMVPHGISVVVGAPSVFRATAPALPERHLEAAVLLGADARGAGPGDEGEILAREIVRSDARDVGPARHRRRSATARAISMRSRAARSSRRASSRTPRRRSTSLRCAPCSKGRSSYE